MQSIKKSTFLAISTWGFFQLPELQLVVVAPFSLLPQDGYQQTKEQMRSLAPLRFVCTETVSKILLSRSGPEYSWIRQKTAVLLRKFIGFLRT